MCNMCHTNADVCVHVGVGVRVRVCVCKMGFLCKSVLTTDVS